jgi:hypothetical protein
MRAFIIRPFGLKQDKSGTDIDFEKVDEQLISPALDCQARRSFYGL